MAFKSKNATNIHAESPESLFADIKAKKIKGLLASQAELLREYVEKYSDSPDLAAQLPTGAGKTLVAILIGEWRRITKQERVVYLCPTKQLVNQVARQSREIYGIPVEPFTGRIVDFSSQSRVRYNSSQRIAVATYNALFNSNPFFEDPNVIILDDAHAAENAVASNWTIELKQYVEDDQTLFNAISSVLRPHLDGSTYNRFAFPADSSADLSWVDKIPYEVTLEFAEELESVIDSNVGEHQARYAWKGLKGHLKACNIFIGSQTILIRPLLAPTFSHNPFENAKQRIYLSATPGEGGELERVFCRRRIDRLTPPAGTEKHAIGRRFFIFPELGLDDEERSELFKNLGNNHRVLDLVGDNATAEKHKSFFKEHTNAKVFSASDIESDKTEFVESSPAVAVFANRYDGIDFPDGECRITLLSDLPTGANLQENFLISRLSAGRIIDSRILTRIVQAFGRCTRGTTDYSAVIVLGDKIVSYLSKADRQKYFHTELQGELKFGFAESSDVDLEGILENLENFLIQSDDWKGAEAEIYKFRDSAKHEVLQGSVDLTATVQYEVNFVECLWNGDVTGALEACRSVLGLLESPDLRGVRALWSYLAGSMASRIAENGETGARAISRNYYRAAGKAAPSLSWLHDLGKRFQCADESTSITDLEAKQLDRIEREFEKHGMAHDREFNKWDAEIRKELTSNFEMGHMKLGKYLGFDSGKVETNGSPDPWWKASDSHFLVFEDHADALETSSLDVTKARQATTHRNWIRTNFALGDEATIISVLITPVGEVDHGAMCHLQDVKVWNLADFKAWAFESLSVIRDLRSSFLEAGDLVWRTDALTQLREKNLTAEKISQMLNFGPDALKER